VAHPSSDGDVQADMNSDDLDYVNAEPLAAAWAAGLRRTQLWSALSGIIPLFGALTLPVHTTLEPLVTLSARFTGAAAPRHTVQPGQKTHKVDARSGSLSFHTPASPTVSVSCRGEHVLLSCRECPGSWSTASVETLFAAASVLVTPTTQNDATQSVNTGIEGNRSAFNALRTTRLDRLVSSAHEVSVLQLPPPFSDATSRDLDSRSTASLAESVNSSFASSNTTTSSLSRQKRRERQRAVFLEPLPECYVLRPTTNCVVPMPPPLPKTVAAGYGAARLVAEPLLPIKKKKKKQPG
jgi:hypothetical protein